MKNVYPVIFTQVDECVLVEVPDLEILTEGTDMVNAIDMARDAIGLKGITLEDLGQEIPTPSDIDSVKIEDGSFSEVGKGIVSLVDIDFTAYRVSLDNKTVRRNVTLPNWLNQAAEKSGVNVSRILQEALMAKLNIYK